MYWNLNSTLVYSSVDRARSLEGHTLWVLSVGPSYWRRRRRPTVVVRIRIKCRPTFRMFVCCCCTKWIIRCGVCSDRLPWIVRCLRWCLDRLPLDTCRYLAESFCDCQLVSQSISQSLSQSVSQYVNQSVSQSVSQYVSQSVSQSINQSVSTSDSQSIS